MNSNQNLIPLDIIGTDNLNPIDISFQHKLCAYSIGSLIILYNMQNDNKKFITYHQNPIALIKILNNDFLISIDFSSSPMLIIWDLLSLRIAIEFPIKTYPNFKVGAVYIDKVKQDKHLLLITSVDCNLLYELNVSEHKDITFAFISKLKAEAFVIGFKCFNSSNDFAIALPDILEYYRLTNQDNNSQYNNNTPLAQFLFRINFPFRLQYDTLRISPIVNILAVLNEQGTCLLFDQNGNAKPNLIPFQQEMFSCCEFSKDSLLLGTSNGKIYCYNSCDYKMIYYIQSAIFPKADLLFGKDRKQPINDDIIQDSPQINQIIMDEALNMILIQSKDNSILLSPISDILKGIRKQFNFISTGVSLTKFAYSHYDKVTSIECINRFSSDFYSSSADQSLMLWRKLNGKWTNTYYDLEKANNSMLNNYSNQSTNKVYFSVIKLHPEYRNLLFAGDNKGCLYVFETNDQIFQYKKHVVGTYCIASLSFNTKSNLVSICFDSGMNVIYDLNNNCEFSLKLSDHIFNPAEIEARVLKGHIVAYSYFFTIRHQNENNKSKHDCHIVYLKSSDELQISRLYTSSNHETEILYSQNEKVLQFPDDILDIAMHPSEDYVIALVKGRKIAIVQIDNGDIAGVIDLESHTSYCYNITLDPSGLFIGVVCNLVSDQEMKSSLIIFEVGTGNVKTSIASLFEISKCQFAINGSELIISGAKGFMSIWELPTDMRKLVDYVLEEMKRNNAFWSQYEIKYNFDNEGIGALDDNKDESINSKHVYNMTSYNNNNNNRNQIKEVKSNSKQPNLFDDINRETANINKEIEKLQKDKRNKDTTTEGLLLNDDGHLIRKGYSDKDNANTNTNANEVIKENHPNQVLTISELRNDIEKKNVMPDIKRQNNTKDNEERKDSLKSLANQFQLTDNYKRFHTEGRNHQRYTNQNQLTNPKKSIPSYQPLQANSSSQRNFDYNQFAIKKENQFEAIPKLPMKIVQDNINNTQPLSYQSNQPFTFSNRNIINSNTNSVANQNSQLKIKELSRQINPLKKDTDFVINLNQDPNFFKSIPQHKNQTHNQPLSHKSYSNINQKAISTSSEKQQNSTRMQNISKAINDILLPQKEHQATKIEPHYEPKVTEKNKIIIVSDEVLLTGEEKDYYINNNPPKKVRYPEPEDIDDLISNLDNKSNDTENNDNGHYYKAQKDKLKSSKPIQENTTNQIAIPISNKNEDSNSIYQPISVTDEIDYFSDNIRNFEQVHKIK